MTGDDETDENRLTVALLGPLDVALDGRRVPLTTGRLRTVLAVLAMSAGRPVPVKRLAEAVWGERVPGSAQGSLQTPAGRLRPVPVKRLAEAVGDERLPGSAKGSLQTYVGRLRRILGSERISTSPAGFALRIRAEDVDTLHFGRLLDRAATAGDTEGERELLTRALALWRGEPFEDIASAELERTEH